MIHIKPPIAHAHLPGVFYHTLLKNNPVYSPQTTGTYLPLRPEQYFRPVAGPELTSTPPLLWKRKYNPH